MYEIICQILKFLNSTEVSYRLYHIYLILYKEDVMKNHSQAVLILAIGLITSAFFDGTEHKTPTSVRSAPPLVTGDNVYVGLVE